MDPHFGCGIRRYIFDQDHPTTYSEISAKIYEQVEKYLSYIQLEHIDFQSQGTGNTDVPDNTVQIRIIFNIKPLNRRETLDVAVT